MDTTVKRSRVVEMWEERMVSAGARFAELRTSKAQYDRVAVVDISERNITVEYPAMQRESEKVSWRIKREIVPLGEVEILQWYLG